MPTYALLGATGSTGTAILRHLLSNTTSRPEGLKLNILVRSREKLLSAFPDLESANQPFAIAIFEGSINDNETATLRECLQDVDVIFACIGTNEAHSGMTIVQDATTSIITALKQHKKDQGANYKSPIIIQLRSSSLNPSPNLPVMERKMAWFFLYHIYIDLSRACELLANADPDLLRYIFVDPPSIHDAEGTEATGYELLTGSEEGKMQESAINYADLGVAFCEVAERRREFVGESVLVSATGAVRTTWGPLMGFMARGLGSRIWG